MPLLYPEPEQKPLKDPPPPQALLYLPMLVCGKAISALLDSGASDSFISQGIVQELHLRTYPLRVPLTLRVANGQTIPVTHFIRVSVLLGSMALRLMLRVVASPIPIVLGYPFLLKFSPEVDWKKRIVRVTRNGRTYEIAASPASCSFAATMMEEEQATATEVPMPTATETLTQSAVPMSVSTVAEPMMRLSELQTSLVALQHELATLRRSTTPAPRQQLQTYPQTPAVPVSGGALRSPLPPLLPAPSIPVTYVDSATQVDTSDSINWEDYAPLRPNAPHQSATLHSQLPLQLTVRVQQIPEPISSVIPNSDDLHETCRDTYLYNLEQDLELPHFTLSQVAETDPTPEDYQEVLCQAEAPDTNRSGVKKPIRPTNPETSVVDHTICGPPCRTVPTPGGDQEPPGILCGCVLQEAGTRTPSGATHRPPY